MTPNNSETNGFILLQSKIKTNETRFNLETDIEIIL